jgi:hypothetical protein
MKISDVFGVSGKLLARSAVIGALSLAASVAVAAPAAPPTPAQLHDAWGDSIAQTPLPGEGCFSADYPSTSWKPVACITAPNHKYGPARGASGYTVGDGNDFAAVSSGIISSSIGRFSSVKGVTTEKDDGTSNEYSLQLNTQFFSLSPACALAKVPTNCLAWQQFVFAEQGTGVAFMQYWLINYSATCPKGWYTSGDDCYTNSRAVGVPTQTISQLGSLKVSGAATLGGVDKMVLVTATSSYATSGKDSVVDLAAFWNASEFNIFGDGDGTEATFNAGPTIDVKIGVDDGTTNAPTCTANSGTTAETNNLTLGKNCKAVGGARPSVTFVERN